MLGDPSEFELAWAKANPVRRKWVQPPPALSNCNIESSYTSHTQAPGTAAASSGAPRTAHTQQTLPTTAHSLAAATLPATAPDGVPKVAQPTNHHCCSVTLKQGSWSEGSDRAPQISQAEQDYAAKLERERTLRHTLQALQENKVVDAKSTAAKLQKKVKAAVLSRNFRGMTSDRRSLKEWRR